MEIEYLHNVRRQAERSLRLCENHPQSPIAQQLQDSFIHILDELARAGITAPAQSAPSTVASLETASTAKATAERERLLHGALEYANKLPW